MSELAPQVRRNAQADVAAVSPIGAVVIGRNEGERLRTSLRSVMPCFDHVVYVDSGSSDDSVALAERYGAAQVVLDRSLPFTAARARNAGMAWMTLHHPDVKLVQLIDGDCELDRDWPATAIEALAKLPGAAVVCGRRRERFPEASVYNALCNREWNTPVGVVKTCGGDALVRVDAFNAVGGFSPELIAGEEPDLCHKLRGAGWTIHRLDAEMTRHDAAMTRAAQWWNRNKRSGYAFAEAWWRRGDSDVYPRKRVLNNLLWGMPPAWALWPLLWWRVYRRSDAAYATHIVLGKIPHVQGQVRFWLDRLRARRSTLIEYK
jgi:glycosyltransferase involved in cell wall biosynthesis